MTSWEDPRIRNKSQGTPQHYPVDFVSQQVTQPFSNRLLYMLIYIWSVWNLIQCGIWVDLFRTQRVCIFVYWNCNVEFVNVEKFECFHLILLYFLCQLEMIFDSKYSNWSKYKVNKLRIWKKIHLKIWWKCQYFWLYEIHYELFQIEIRKAMKGFRKKKIEQVKYQTFLCDLMTYSCIQIQIVNIEYCWI